MEEVKREETVDILSTVKKLRQLRPKLVQTQEQYLFIYQASTSRQTQEQYLFIYQASTS